MVDGPTPQPGRATKQIHWYKRCRLYVPVGSFVPTVIPRLGKKTAGKIENR